MEMVGTRPGNDGRGMHPNTTPLGTATYLYKAKEMKNLARSTKTGAACKGGVKNEQCRHTCAGYNAECMDYEKNDAADTLIIMSDYMVCNLQ